MKRKPLTLSRSLAFAAPAIAAYVLVAPAVCARLDRAFAIREVVPRWLQPLGIVLLASGALIAIWTFVLFAFMGNGTPNPVAPPQNLVRSGPYRYSRNPMMLSGWIAGFGLGLLLRSPSYLLLCVVIVLTGTTYVVFFEEPALLRRFGTAYSEYSQSTPRWLRCPHCC